MSGFYDLRRNQQSLSKPLHNQPPYRWDADSRLDSILLADATKSGLPDESVALIITSPPYGVGLAYDVDQTMEQYLQFLTDVYTECYRVLEVGGRICVNTANTGRKPYCPLTAHTWKILTSIGFLGRGEIIWDKGNLQNNKTSWGSWTSAANPTLRDRHEYVLVACKAQFARNRKGVSTITSEEFTKYTQSIWDIAPAHASRVGHPAPFPLELPRRLIKLYSYVSDVVWDPLCGSGTTCLAALQEGRHYIGTDLSPEYVDLARKRVWFG